MAREESNREQHREMSYRQPRGGGAIDERSSTSDWTGQPPVCEPNKPSGTPASHGGDKGR